MGIRIGVCGAGAFGGAFIPLFQAHPLVDDVYIAEVFPDCRAEQAARHGITHAYASLDELCDSDVDAIAIFAQRWMHGPMALQALRAGKHVYSAVPSGITLDEIGSLVQAVTDTGLIYMLGETSYYYPSTLYCRQRFQAGDFGRFVYGEAEYLHDMSHGFYSSYQSSGGPDWKRTASFPPMLYPTHSVSMIVSVTGARFTQVSCLGQVDQIDDGVFLKDVSLWQNEFSNSTGLFRTSDGGMARINEFRRVGLSGGTSVRMSMYGTLGSYEEQTNARVWNTLRKAEQQDLSELLRSRQTPVSAEQAASVPESLRDDFFRGVTAVHPVERLPKELQGLPNGHEGSHLFLLCDFVEACVSGRQPVNNIWAAARYNVPGIIAHESARQGGALLDIPDFGDPPVTG